MIIRILFGIVCEILLLGIAYVWLLLFDPIFNSEIWSMTDGVIGCAIGLLCFVVFIIFVLGLLIIIACMTHVLDYVCQTE